MARKLPPVYPNLAAEMTRDNVTRDDLAGVVGKTTECVGGWITGKSGEFPISAAIAVQATFWPSIPLAELFKRVEPAAIHEPAVEAAA